MKQSIERRIDSAFRESCSAIQIRLLDIGKVFAVGRKLIANGNDDAALRAGLRAYVETIRV